MDNSKICMQNNDGRQESAVNKTVRVYATVKQETNICTFYKAQFTWCTKSS